MSRINSRAKGARAERAFALWLKEEGWHAKRGVQHAGQDAPDVICPDLSWLHFEVKHVQALNIIDAMSQAKRDAGAKVPVVAHRKNGTPWLITLPADEFAKFLRGDLPPEK